MRLLLTYFSQATPSLSWSSRGRYDLSPRGMFFTPTLKAAVQFLKYLPLVGLPAEPALVVLLFVLVVLVPVVVSVVLVPVDALVVALVEVSGVASLVAMYPKAPSQATMMAERIGKALLLRNPSGSRMNRTSAMAIGMIGRQIR